MQQATTKSETKELTALQQQFWGISPHNKHLWSHQANIADFQDLKKKRIFSSSADEIAGKFQMRNLN